MATGKIGFWVLIAAIAVLGVGAVVYFSDWLAPVEDATGAIGAAERYRAEQITDEDVILDIPGQEEFAKAVYDGMTDEQKADLLARVGEAGRKNFYDRFNQPGFFERMTDEEMGRFVVALDTGAQGRVAEALRFDAEGVGRIDADTLGRALAGMDAQARADAIGRFEARSAFERMDDGQIGHFARALDADALGRVAENLRFDAEGVGRMDVDTIGRAFSHMDAEARANAIGQFEAREAIGRMDEDQLGHFALALDADALGRISEALRFDAEGVGRADPGALGRAMKAMDADARANAIGNFEARDALGRMNENQLGHFARALDADALGRLAQGLRFDAEGIGRMDVDTIGRAISHMDAEARANAVGQFEAREAIGRMNENQLGHFALALDAAALGRIGKNLRFDAEGIGRIDAGAVGRATRQLSAEARAEAFGRYEFNEAVFERMNSHQRGAFADALGAKALNRAVIQGRVFNRMSEPQQRQVWATMGRDAQLAALRYSGMEADLARGADALERTRDFERYVQERSAQGRAETR